MDPSRARLAWVIIAGAVGALIYVALTFSWFGLILWEVAPVFLVPSLIGIAWAARRVVWTRRGRVPKLKPKLKPKPKLVAFTLVVNVGFCVFAVVPVALVPTLGAQFETELARVLGTDYWDRVPLQYQDRTKRAGRYFDNRDFRAFFNREVVVERDVAYGNGSFQRLDRYEAPGIPGAAKPGLVFIHGGGSLEYSDAKASATSKWACTYYASLGFVAFSVEYTSATVEPFPRAVRDCLQAIAFIKGHAATYHVDPSALVLLGPSRGGHLVTLCSLVPYHQDPWWHARGANYTPAEAGVACVVDFYGAVDPAYPFENRGFLKSRNPILFNGTPETQPARYAKHAVKNYVHAAGPPTLVMHGTVDGMVQVGESRELVAAMTRAGQPHAYLEVPFGQHGFDAVPGTAGNQLAYYFAPRFILATLFPAASRLPG